MDIRQTPQWAAFMKKIGWENQSFGTPDGGTCYVYIKNVPLVGSIVKCPRPSYVSFEILNEIAKKNRALFLKIEPDGEIPNEKDFIEEGFINDGWPLCPTKVYRIEITDPIERIIEKFDKDARYSISKAERNGVVVEVIKLNDSKTRESAIKNFYRLLKKTSERKGFWIQPRKELEQKAESFYDNTYLILAKLGDEYLSGALIVANNKTAYYEHAASTQLGRKLLAQYLVVWETIRLGKILGCETVDLGGVGDPRYKISKNWTSLETFKAKFNAYPVTYPGSYTKFYNPLMKLLFRFG